MVDLSPISKLFTSGKASLALDEYTRLFNDPNLEDSEALILKSRILRSVGNIEASMEITSILKENLDNQPENLKLHILLAHTYNLSTMGKANLAIPFIEQMKPFVELLDDDNPEQLDSLGSYYNICGVNQWQLGNLDRALNNYNQCLDIYMKLKDKVSIASTLNNIGVIYWNRGDLDHALTTYSKVLQIYEKEENLPKKAKTLNNIGLIYSNKGQYAKSLQYYNDALEIQSLQKLENDVAITLNNIGVIHKTRGELDKGIEIFYQALKINKKLSNQPEMATNLNNIGLIYFEQGEYDLAENALLKSLKYRKTSNNSLSLSLIYYNLIRLYTWQDDLQIAENYLHKLRQLVDGSSNKKVKLYYQLTEGIYYNNLDRSKHKVQAQTIFYQIINQELINTKLTVEAIKHLTENLLEELKIYGSEDILEEIERLINQFDEIAISENLFPFIVQVNILRYRLELIKGDLDSSMNFLQKAEEIANNKGLVKLKSSIQKEHTQLDNNLELWKNLQKLNLPLSMKIKFSFVYNYLETQQRSVLQNMEYIETTQIDDDQIFSMLSNSTRREIFKEIYLQKSLPFSAIKKSWNLSSGSTKNHLKNMEPFLIQNEDKSYSLNVSGRTVANWLFGNSNLVKIYKI